MCSCPSHKYVFRFTLTVHDISHCKKMLPHNDLIGPSITLEASGSKIQCAHGSLGDTDKNADLGSFATRD